MEVIVNNKFALTDIVNPATIHSIVVARKRNYRYIVITMKRGYIIPFLQDKEQCFVNRGYTYAIGLSQFSYSAPSYVAIPERYYNQIIISDCTSVDTNARFFKAKIDKEIFW